MTWLIITVVVLLVLVLAAAQVGGRQIRTAGLTREIAVIDAPTVLTRGAPTMVQFSGLSEGLVEAAGEASMFFMRTPDETVQVGRVDRASLVRGSVQVTVPCEADVPKDTAHVWLMVFSDQAGVVAQSLDRVEIAVPGRECFF